MLLITKYYTFISFMILFILSGNNKNILKVFNFCFIRVNLDAYLFNKIKIITETENCGC